METQKGNGRIKANYLLRARIWKEISGFTESLKENHYEEAK